MFVGWFATTAVAFGNRCLLQLHPAVRCCLESMHCGELSRIVYRDHITLKHSPRKRLQEELHDKTKRLDQHLPSNGNLCILGPGAEKNDPLSKMLIQYLLEALKKNLENGR